MMQVIECEQNSDEWYRARMGMATASEFSTVMASGRDGGESKTRKTYLYKLAGEIITGEPMDSYSNAHMERGKEQEDKARELYSLSHGVDIERVGFVVNGIAGCSPDGLIGKDGMSEIKTKLAHLQVECLLRDKFPAEHIAQCQGGLWVAEREWIDLVAYSPKLPLFVKRAWRDEPYIKKLETAVRAFNDELAEIVHKMKARGATVAVAA